MFAGLSLIFGQNLAQPRFGQPEVIGHAKVPNRLLNASHLFVRATPVGVGKGIVRVEKHRLVIVGDGILEVLGFVINHAAADVSQGIGGIQPDRGVEVVERLGIIVRQGGGKGDRG